MNNANATETTIRPTDAADIPQLVDLAQETGVFKPLEIVALREVLDDYFATNRAAGHCAATCEASGTILGFAYYAPDAMTDRTWTLWWIAVKKTLHAQGIGGQLLAHLERDAQRQGARHLLIETSSLPYYELTRRFYLKYGYEQVAVVPEYYAADDDKVVFRKKF